MEVINTVVGKIVEVLTDRFLAFMGRRIGYVVHYKKNINDLDAQVQNLRGVKERIEGKVETAKNNGEVIEKDVLNWLTEVNKKEEDVNRLLANNENIKSCFDVRSRYRLGKEGKKKLTDVLGLIEQASKFDTVGRPAPLDDIWYTGTTNFEQFESRESVFKQIIQALKNDTIYKIGIHGMGGSGKTRMAEEIAKHAKTEKLFDKVAKAVFSQNPDLKKIQEELADCLELSFKKNTEAGRKGELCNRLKNGEKILVIIDDIWNDEIKLEDIGIPSSNDHFKGCKVLLTSRREDVCVQMGVQENFQIGLLWEHEAWYLFKKTVGDFIEFPREIHSVAKQVCRECDHLPLAILVVGAAMRDQKEKCVWDDAHVQLSNCSGDNIEGMYEKLYSRIEWSYKYLKQTDARSCFLHCSLFPEDYEIPIDDLVMYGVGTRFLKHNRDSMKIARDRILVLVDTLKKSHLLLEGESKDLVKMHDIIRDVAILIASKEGFLSKPNVREWPERDEYESCRVISLRSKQICELPCELQCAELRTLVLKCNTRHKPQVPDNFFKGMKKLEVLDLRSVRLPSSPLNLINLRMLRLHDCEQVNLAFLKELRKLEILSIDDSDLKEVAVEVGQLTNLRWLDLSCCRKLKIIPSGVIGSLSKIEELYIPHDFGEWGVEGNARLDELNLLTGLTTLQIHIGDGMLLPNELCFKFLNRFKISIGRTRAFHSYERDLGAGILKLDDISLRKEFNILTEKAEVLLLKRVEGVKNVLHYGDGKGFLDVKYLQIEDCSDMEYLLGRPKWNVQTQGSFCKLSVLIVKDCTLKFMFYPSTVRALLLLQKLKISRCRIMEEIILDDDGELKDKVIFPQLKEMNLRYLPNLRSICGANRKKTSSTECNISDLTQTLFNEKVSFPALEELKIKELKSITWIWDNQLFLGSEAKEESSFQWLWDIQIERCQKLVNVIPFNLIPMLKNLETIQIQECESVVSIVEVLTIEKGSARKEHSDQRLNIGAYSNLRYLTIEYCHSLRNVFSSSIARNLGQLQDLTITDCEGIEEIIAIDEVIDEKIIVFPQLKKMELIELPNLKSFCGSKKEAAEDDNIPQLQSFFNHKVSFPALEVLELTELGSIIAIWDNQLFLDSGAEEESSFQQLRDIHIQICEKLVNVITAVETGEGEGEGEGVTGDEIIVFPHLKNMELEGLSKLKSFYGSKKTSVEDDNITQVQALFNYMVSFPTLEVLEVTNLGSITAIWDNQLLLGLEAEEEPSFHRLRDIEIRNCEKLVNVIIAVGTEEGEEDVTDDKIIVFSRLKNMELEGLSKLKSFYGSKKVAVEDDNITQVQALFNYMVRFPCLESFQYKEHKNNVKEIWNSTVPTDAFCKLRVLFVYDCDELLSVAPSKLLGSLWNLEELSIYRCPSLEEVFKVEGGSNTKDGMVARGTDIEKDLEDNLVFPQLKYVAFDSLPRLRIFYRMSRIYELPSLKDVTITCCPKLEMFPCRYQNNVTAPLQPFSNEKVAFPVLENLGLSDGSILEDIWYGHVPAASFSKVRKLQLSYCRMLVNIPTLLLQRFEVVEELTVKRSDSLQVVFEGLEDIKRGATVFSQITKLDPYHNLTSLIVQFCHSLKCLFSLSIARNLTNIEQLHVGWCNAIEEIIKNEDQGEEDGAMDEIVFPKLQSIELYDLPNLTSFCWAKNAFKLPSLQNVRLQKCIEMQTFTSGQISTPVIKLDDDNNEDKEVSDLNNYVQQLVQERKGITMYKDDEETSVGKEKESGNHDEETEDEETEDDEEEDV